jgi:hypothetical protein
MDVRNAPASKNLHEDNAFGARRCMLLIASAEKHLSASGEDEKPRH